jgi:hypothetical protein
VTAGATGGWIIVLFFLLFCYCLIKTVWRNYDAISMFSPWKWICGSSHGSNAVKVLFGASVVSALLMLEGYMAVYHL